MKKLSLIVIISAVVGCSSSPAQKCEVWEKQYRSKTSCNEMSCTDFEYPVRVCRKYYPLSDGA